LEVREVVFEFDAKIDQGVAFETLKIAAFGSQVSAAVHANDELTPAAQKLVSTEILNMSTVRNIEILHVLLNPTRNFCKEICRADAANFHLIETPKVRKPVAKPNIEQRHKKAIIWKRSPSHVRGCGSAGDSHCSPQIDMRIGPFNLRSRHITADRRSAEKGANNEKIPVSPTQIGVGAGRQVHDAVDQVIGCCARSTHLRERQPDARGDLRRCSVPDFSRLCCFAPFAVSAPELSNRGLP